MRTPPMPTRRCLLAGAMGALTISSRSPAAEAGGATLLVAGPPRGRLDRWSSVLGPAVGRGLPSHMPLECRNVGGIDGVTGANQFEARAEPDGQTALLLPGIAALSWLTGEARARFDFAQWVPLWAGMGSAVLVSRMGLAPGAALRVAANSPAGPELPALLALDLIGVSAAPSPTASADAMLLQGPDMLAGMASAAAVGMRPVMTFGALNQDGLMGRDPTMPLVPTAFELVQGRAQADVLAALRASACAVQLAATIVLPALTPAAAVSVWRYACKSLQQDASVQDEAARLGARCLYPDSVSAYTSKVAGNRTAVLALRQWLATRYDWRPS